MLLDQINLNVVSIYILYNITSTPIVYWHWDWCILMYCICVFWSGSCVAHMSVCSYLCLGIFWYYLHCAFGCTLWHTTCSASAVRIVVFRRYSCCICYWIRFAMYLHLALLDVICSVLPICLQCGCTNSEGLFCSFSCFLGWSPAKKKFLRQCFFTCPRSSQIQMIWKDLQHPVFH